MFTENGYQPNTNIPNDYVVYQTKPQKKRARKSKSKSPSDKLDLFILPLIGACAVSLAYLVWQAVSNTAVISAIAGLL